MQPLPYDRVVLPAFTAVAYVPVIILERPLFLRERNDGLYRVITYLSFKISEVCALTHGAVERHDALWQSSVQDAGVALLHSTANRSARLRRWQLR